MSGHDRSLAAPAFPDDDGQVAPALASALATEPETRDDAVLEVYGGVRVFVPVVATLGAGGRTEAGGDKDADMAAVLMTGADGRQALLTFSSVEAMGRWDAHARPVPVWGRDAARAALDEGASALLLDLAGPGFTVVETEDVQHLAAGHRLVRTDAGTAWLT